jgi:hypothetical protein
MKLKRLRMILLKWRQLLLLLLLLKISMTRMRMRNRLLHSLKMILNRLLNRFLISSVELNFRIIYIFWIFLKSCCIILSTSILYLFLSLLFHSTHYHLRNISLLIRIIKHYLLCKIRPSIRNNL